VTEADLQQRRAEFWRVNGNPVRTLEDARSFLDSVGFCLMYPVRGLLLIPTFFAAYAGSATELPDAKHAFADPRTQPATDLMVRLLREHQAYEVNVVPENSLVVSAAFFPFIYALLGDRKPKAPPKVKAQGEKVSPLGVKAFEVIQEQGPLSNGQLRVLLGRELTTSALDRALNELWSILKITRVDYREQEGAYWDVLYRWAPEAVLQGSHYSVAEAISALIGKYLQAVVAASREEIEEFFSHLASRSKIREAINALLAARQLDFIAVGNKNLIHLHLATGSEDRDPVKRRDNARNGPGMRRRVNG
jgi:hypothetical protein